MENRDDELKKIMRRRRKIEIGIFICLGIVVITSLVQVVCGILVLTQ